ncbi:hypothetical protein [Streptomyces sp. NPDC088261]|uniref:hypothetical protein n=1 Tax=Streptomyces sp. NPDC088261 TaxID=3365851 RepID=UPI0038256B53
MSHRTPSRQRLGTAEALVIITIVVTPGILIGMSPDGPSLSPNHTLVLIVTAAFAGVIAVRLARVGLIGQVRAVAARTLALAPPPAQGSAEAEE